MCPAGGTPAIMAGKMVEVEGVEPSSELVPLGAIASRITVYTPVLGKIGHSAYPPRHDHASADFSSGR